jgi:hypothetical protein
MEFLMLEFVVSNIGGGANSRLSMTGGQFGRLSVQGGNSSTTNAIANANASSTCHRNNGTSHERSSPQFPDGTSTPTVDAIMKQQIPASKNSMIIGLNKEIANNVSESRLSVMTTANMALQMSRDSVAHVQRMRGESKETVSPADESTKADENRKRSKILNGEELDDAREVTYSTKSESRIEIGANSTKGDGMTEVKTETTAIPRSASDQTVGGTKPSQRLTLNAIAPDLDMKKPSPAKPQGVSHESELIDLPIDGLTNSILVENGKTNGNDTFDNRRNTINEKTTDVHTAVVTSSTNKEADEKEDRIFEQNDEMLQALVDMGCITQLFIDSMESMDNTNKANYLQAALAHSMYQNFLGGCVAADNPIFTTLVVATENSDAITYFSGVQANLNMMKSQAAQMTAQAQLGNMMNRTTPGLNLPAACDFIIFKFAWTPEKYVIASEFSVATTKVVKIGLSAATHPPRKF